MPRGRKKIEKKVKNNEKEPETRIDSPFGTLIVEAKGLRQLKTKQKFPGKPA